MKTVLILLLASYVPVWAACHPQVDWSRPQFVIGYGSLIYTPSKQKTLAHSGPNYPVLVQGYQRSWLVRGWFLSRPTTFLGVEPKADTWMNGVIFQVYQQVALRQLDAREKGYCRRQVSAKQLKILHGPGLKQAQYWIYLPQKKVKYYANSQYPLSIYYANIFLSGCLEMANQYHLPHFAQQCFTTTKAWPKYFDGYYPEDALPVSKKLFATFYRDFWGHKRHKLDA